MEHRAGSLAAEGLHRGEVEAPRAEGAAEHEQAALAGADPEALAGLGPVGLAGPRRHRPPRDQVAVRVEALDRKGEADAAGERSERAVGDAQVAVGLREEKRDPAGDRC